MRLGPLVAPLPIIPRLSDHVQLERALFGAYPASLNPDQLVAYNVAALPTHPGATLIEARAAGAAPVYAFMAKQLRYVSGAPADVYALNAGCTPVLAGVGAIRSYLRLWLETARGRKGWRLVEEARDIAWISTPPVEFVDFARSLVRPLSAGEPGRGGRCEASAILQMSGALLSRRLLLWPSGIVHMIEDTVLATDPALAAPEALAPFSSLCGTPHALVARPGRNAAEVSLCGSPPRVERRENDPQTDETEASEERPREPIWDLAAIFGRIAETLLLRALAQADIGKPDDDAAGKFFAYLTNFRPMVAIETPYRDLRDDFAKYVAGRTKLDFRLDGATVGASVSSASVVLLTEAIVPPDDTATDFVARLGPVVRGPHVGLIVVERKGILPQDIRDMIDYSVEVPRMDETTFWACSSAIFGEDLTPTRGEWVRYVLPRDMARVAAATRNARDYVAQLEATIMRRLAQYAMPEAPSLRDLQGLGEAKFRFEELAADISGAIDGTISWDEVDRGYLLFGPPGTGKTTLIKALAKDCGIRVILASAASWQERTSLGPHIQAIRSTFREARLYAPAILFIDEIDSLGSRARTEEQNNQYQTVVINTVLEELQGFEDREGVIVIGATNNLDSIDEAIRRPGRLDRLVEVPYPNVAALASIYRYYLERAARDGLSCDGIDAQRLAELTFGRTGSHVELYVRSAVRQARRRGRSLLLERDIVNEITARPPEGFGLNVTPKVMRRTAVHEAGHALVSLKGANRERHVPIVSIIPRADGSLGFMARAPLVAGALTRDEMEEDIRVILGGRAAEEIVFGHDHVSAGSGGSARSDLALATESVIALLTEFGFSKAGGLLWIDWHSRGVTPQVTADAIRNLPIGHDILREARDAADGLYAETLTRLREHHAALDAIAAALIDKQELSSEELNALLQT